MAAPPPEAPHVYELWPMLLDNRKHLPYSYPDWLFEIKYDGWRAALGGSRPVLNLR